MTEPASDIAGLGRITAGGYCIGCGACRVATGSIPIEMTREGMFQARIGAISEQQAADALRVCPFADQSPNEDALSKTLFGDACGHDPGIGAFRDLWIGHASKGGFREHGTSGGIISWLLAELLERGHVDAVAHVKPVRAPDDAVLFRYGFSRTREEVLQSTKSRYYPVEMSEVLQMIRDKPGRYAITGLPCFITAVRHLQAQDPVLRERIVTCIGLVCGHLKSRAFADYFGWQAGIRPGRLTEIDFRVKLEGRVANDYGVLMAGDGVRTVHRTRTLLGSNWGCNFFRYPACDYCDDVFAETADVAVGDAWLPEYVADGKGTSIVLVRDATLGRLIREARQQERLHLVEASVDNLLESQAGGLRDRREGLAYRLHLRRRKGDWVPRKRVEPGQAGIINRRRRVYRNRIEMGRRSHELWVECAQSGSRARMDEGVRRMMRLHDRSTKGFYARATTAAKRWLKKVLRRGTRLD